MGSIHELSQEGCRSKASTNTSHNETVSELIARLQNNTDCTNPLQIYFSTDFHDEPAVIEKDTLRSLSNAFASTFRRHTEEDERDAIAFCEYTSDTIRLFLYWLTHRRIPDIENVDTLPEPSSAQAKSDYQLLLTRLYYFAEDKKTPALQNDAMESFVASLWETDLTLERLQTILLEAPRACKLRLAVLDDALWLEENEGFELLEGLDTNEMSGLMSDMRDAKAAYDGRKGARGKGKDYLVADAEVAGEK